MSDLHIYRQNLEALRLNGELVGSLTTAMDNALVHDSFAFQGRPDTHWHQVAGQSHERFLEATTHHAAELLAATGDEYRTYAEATGQPPVGIQSYGWLKFAFRTVPRGDNGYSYVRRFEVAGINDSRAASTADHYRFEWVPEVGGLKTAFVLAHVGDVAVKAELWHKPDDNEFARHCMDTFANSQVVSNVLSGGFEGEEELDAMLSQLIVEPEHADLFIELRARALATRQSNKLAAELNLVFPDRAQLVSTLKTLRAAF